jgi:hypothetical protein
MPQPLLSQDLTHPPTTSPSTTPTLAHDSATYRSFCGKSRAHAISICSLKTKCRVDGDCPRGAACHADLPDARCNSFYMHFPEFKPTERPTRRPTTTTPTAPTTSPTLAPTLGPTTRAPTVRSDVSVALD